MSAEAVIFGAGNIGRGFIGQLFSESGFLVHFVDIDRELVETMNRHGTYRLQTVYNDEKVDLQVGPVRAIHGSQTDHVAEVVSRAAIGATAVGASALKHIAPLIAKGLERRAGCNAGPFNVLVCENLKGAAKTMRGLVRERLAKQTHEYLERNVGFVDTVIGRMVPVPTPEMRQADVSFIRVEPYKELPVDRSRFVGPIPTVTAMMPQDHFPLFTARKLYIHNCGHALLAYTGYLRGCTYGYEALEDPVVRRVLEGGLNESIAGIVAEYGADRAWLEEHVRDLKRRFANQALGDTVLRLGRDPVRKLNPSDRLVGAALLALKTGHLPRHLAWGIAAALRFDPQEDSCSVDLQQQIRTQGIGQVLANVTSIDPESPLGKTVVSAYQRLTQDRTADMP